MSPAPKETWKNSWIPPTVKLPKGKIEKIDYGEHEEEIKRIWKGLPPTKLVKKWEQAGIKGSYLAGTPLARINKIKVLVGYSSNIVGHCCTCGDLNTHLVKFRTQGITIIERYCTEHVPDKIS